MRSIVNVKTTQNAIFTRNETLVKYYEEVRKFNILSKDEENELFYIIRHGNPIEANKAKDKLINCNQRFVIAIAKRFASNNNILDLINEGNIGLMESIDTFDESKGFSFISWAVWYIRRAINLYSINNGSLIRKSNISKTYHIMSSATNKFLQMNCRQPTHDELLEMVQNDYGVTIKDACDMTETKVSSIDESFNLEDDDIQIPEVYVFNTLTASNNSYEENIECDYKNTMITSMLNQLPKREQLIIKMNFGIGYDKEYKVAEIADVLRLTTERVRQLRAIALNKLKEKAKIKINKV